MLEAKRVKLEAKMSVVGSGGARGAFYRVADNEVRRRRRQLVSGECGLKEFHFEVEKEREGSQPSIVSVGDLKVVTQRFSLPSSCCGRAANDDARCGGAVQTDSRGGSSWRKKKGRGAQVGRLGPKGREERAGSKEGSACHMEDAGQNVDGLQKLFFQFFK
jgi:hypothetical protein